MSVHIDKAIYFYRTGPCSEIALLVLGVLKSF